MDGLDNSTYCKCARENHFRGVTGGGDSSDDDASPGDAVSRVALLPITEVRRRTGLTRKALLVYEELGLVLPAARTEGGYRLYDQRALRRLQLVTWARGLGLSLAEAEEFLEAAERCCGAGQRALRVLVERKLVETVLLLEELDIRWNELLREAAEVAGAAAGGGSQVARSLSSQGANP